MVLMELPLCYVFLFLIIDGVTFFCLLYPCGSNAVFIFLDAIVMEYFFYGIEYPLSSDGEFYLAHPFYSFGHGVVFFEDAVIMLL
jgi:hypothetical protein